MLSFSTTKNTVGLALSSIDKFLLNKLVLFFFLFLFFVSWFVIFQFANNNFIPAAFVVNIICLHYLFNSVHQASHGLLDKDKSINYIYGLIATFFTGVTFADFKFTHDLHHKHVGNTNLDPDHSISGKGFILLIPFKMWHHDLYFLRHSKSKNSLISYILQRVLQASLIVFVVFFSSYSFVTYWLIPMLIVGLANALFLFYIPHYEHWIEKTKFNSFLVKKTINVSRLYHTMHHDKPGRNYNFFPIEKNIMMMIFGADGEILKYQAGSIKIL